MDYLMGIDLGSTSLKAVVYNPGGNVVAAGSQPTERFHPDPAHPEWTVWQPEQIWGSTAAAIRAAAQVDDVRRVRWMAEHMSAACCPVVDERSLGAFVGLDSLATRGDVLRAVIEGLDYQFLDIVEAMEVGLGSRMEKLVAVGGATRNAFWMQNKADVVGRPIDVPNVEEATPLGAAVLAGIGVGLYRDEDDAPARVYRPGTTYEPNAKLSARYAEGFEIYGQLYPALAPISHRLSAEVSA